MTAIKAHFDGKAIVPDEPVDLPLDTLLFVFMDNKHPMTGNDMLQSRHISLWKDRKDVGDPGEYARHLRKQAQTRRRD